MQSKADYLNIRACEWLLNLLFAHGLRKTELASEGKGERASLLYVTTSLFSASDNVTVKPSLLLSTEKETYGESISISNSFQILVVCFLFTSGVYLICRTPFGLEYTGAVG